eukprot:TRINITY_DN12970_c0_g1_i1.p1 TRINITY_DN12970_c0_g1~~TRINITY_DN12970_c0_g1_i1.p1  ORF type:complete len:246 (+),score=60.41 TRINITY_DN12970_c0_g1_i1:55-738(+)
MSSILIVGGAGQLGAAVVAAYKKASWKVVSADFREAPQADLNLLFKGDTLSDVKAAKEKLKENNTKFDVVFSAAGGWEGDSIDDEKVFAAVDKMWRFNVVSAVASGHLAAHFLKEGGLLILTSSVAALEPTPGSIGYGVAKAAAQHLINSLSAPGSNLPKGVSVVGILPVIMDTATNRAAMPDADYSTWTPLDEVSKKLLEWSNKHPGNGESYLVKTVGGKTEWTKH